MLLLNTASRCTLCRLFFFNDTATTEIYTYVHTLSLHDALPIFTLRRRPADLPRPARHLLGPAGNGQLGGRDDWRPLGRHWRCRYPVDRKSTRLNSSH